MSNEEALQAAQEHGDWAFLQGYCAALRDIHINDKMALAQMPEAEKRVNAFQRIFKSLNEKENQHD